MKKDKLYLIISLTIILVSGAIIYGIGKRQSADIEHPPIPDERSQVTVTLLRQISQLKERLEEDPENFNTLVQLGNSYYDLNNPGESVKYYERALEIRPDSPEVLVDCGTMYRELGQIDRATEMFKMAAEMAPDLPQAFFNLGVVYLGEMENPEGAIKIWEEFLEKNPGIDPKLRDFFEERIAQAREMD